MRKTADGTWMPYRKPDEEGEEPTAGKQDKGTVNDEGGKATKREEVFSDKTC